MGFNTRKEAPSSPRTPQKCGQNANGGVSISMNIEEDDSEPASNRLDKPTVRNESVVFVENSSDEETSSIDEIKSSSSTDDWIEPRDTLIQCRRPHFDKPPSFSWVSPKLQLKRAVHGVGLFAVAPIKKDDTLVCWSGKVVHINDVLALPDSERAYILQIDEELYQISPWKGYNEPADFTNHSCNPNAGFKNSPITLAAMRDIMVGEEITFDYAMCESINGIEGNEFECQCGTEFCRGQFTGNDWKIPQLWERYGDYFSPYLLQKIKKLKHGMEM